MNSTAWVVLVPTLVTMVAAILAFVNSRAAVAETIANRAKIDALTKHLASHGRAGSRHPPR